MHEPSLSPRGKRVYGKRAERKQTCKETLRHEDRTAVAVQLEEAEELPKPGLLFCPWGGQFCKLECCNPDWGDPRDYDDFYEHYEDY